MKRSENLIEAITNYRTKNEASWSAHSVVRYSEKEIEEATEHFKKLNCRVSRNNIPNELEIQSK